MGWCGWEIKGEPVNARRCALTCRFSRSTERTCICQTCAKKLLWRSVSSFPAYAQSPNIHPLTGRSDIFIKGEEGREGRVEGMRGVGRGEETSTCMKYRASRARTRTSGSGLSLRMFNESKTPLTSVTAVRHSHTRTRFLMMRTERTGMVCQLCELSVQIQ